MLTRSIETRLGRELLTVRERQTLYGPKNADRSILNKPDPGLPPVRQAMVRTRSVLWLLVLVWSMIGSALPVAGQTSTYTLLSGSDLTDDCLLCDRLSLPIPLQGTFDLLLLESNPLFTRYQLTNIHFQTTGTTGRIYAIKGGGIYQVGGEVALVQDLSLTLQINDGFTNSVHWHPTGGRIRA